MLGVDKPVSDEFHIWGKSRLFTLNTEVMDGEFVLKYVQCSKPVFFVGCL